MRRMGLAAVLLAGTVSLAHPVFAEDEPGPEASADAASEAAAQPDLLARARSLYEASRGEECNGLPFDEPPAPDVHTIEFRPGYAGEDDPLEQATLIRFFCRAGAYNEIHVYYLSTQLDGLRELSFAEPELDIRHEDDDSEKPVEEMRIIGFTTRALLVNSDYVAEDFTITSDAKWRGLGDASSTGLWLFRDGNFTLVRYEVDATYDGEINPQVVLDYFTAP
ncbi:DUF1176 domain-containing protein [Aquibium carbonis]|nr:DUF1176 domain-containing protein [Aquibium carbonis]